MYSENALFSKLNVSEDAPVGNDGDNERKQHADADKEDGVVVSGSAVPQTLLSLGVELVRRPAKVVRQVDGDAGQPREDHGGDNATASTHCVVGGVPADVQVTVDRDESDGEQRRDAADDAEAGCSCTQPLSSIQELLLSHHCTFNATSTYRPPEIESDKADPRMSSLNGVSNECNVFHKYTHVTKYD